MDIIIPTIYTITVIGYQLTNIEYKTITDFNDATNENKYITSIKYGTKWVIPKDVVDGALSDPYWEKWHPLIEARLNKKTPDTYIITIDVSI